MLDLLASLRLPLLGLLAMVVVFAGALPSREKWDRQSVVRLTLLVGMAVSEERQPFRDGTSPSSSRGVVVLDHLHHRLATPGNERTITPNVGSQPRGETSTSNRDLLSTTVPRLPPKLSAVPVRGSDFLPGSCRWFLTPVLDFLSLCAARHFAVIAPAVAPLPLPLSLNPPSRTSQNHERNNGA